MKNYNKIKTTILVVLGIITVFTMVLGICIHAIISIDENSFLNSNLGNTVTNTINLDGDINIIDVNMDIAELKVEYGENPSVSYNLPKKLVPKIEYTNNELCIENTNRILRSFGDLKNLSNKNYKITITIPEGTKLESLNVDVDCGDLRFNDIKASEFSLSSDCGNIEASNLTIDTCDISADFGNIELDKTVCKTINASADCGNIELSNLTTNTCDVSADCGNIELSNVKFDNGEFTNDMGDIKVSGDFPSITADCSAGSIEVETSRNTDDVKFDLNVDLGEIKVNGIKWK